MLKPCLWSQSLPIGEQRIKETKRQSADKTKQQKNQKNKKRKILITYVEMRRFLIYSSKVMFLCSRH